MLQLENHLKLSAETIDAANLCDRFSEKDLKTIGVAVYQGYLQDKASRYKWERRNQAGMDLALQVQKEKSFPWAGCANIAFPLITIAALQFHSRAYPTLLSGTDIVRCRVIGDDPAGEKTARATRISTHMSWQVLEEDSSWENGQDHLLINLGIVGTNFKKGYFDPGKGHQVSELVLAQDLVVNYWTKSLQDCPRKTHVISMFRNQVYERILRKTFRDVREEAWYSVAPPVTADASKARTDNRQGIVQPAAPDEASPFQLLEQHVDMDLDDDGYAEPYIITVEQTSQTVLRIVTGFDEESAIERTMQGDIIKIQRLEYFTKYTFIPSPDGGFYDVGFGVLLGPLNESVNSLINQLMDAGTMAVAAGGFLGRGAKIRGGVYTFAPLEWKRVDSSGEDLKKSIVPLEVREPSAVLFQLLSLLINYVNRIAGTTDPMVGENPGQNTTAETMRTMIQEGSKIYSAIFKRVWRSMKDEFGLRFKLNGIYMPRRKTFGIGQQAMREDYLGNPDDIAPVADPNVTSESMQLQQVQFLATRAGSVPGYDPGAVERRLLKVMKIDGIDQIYPGIEKTGAPKDVKIQIQELKNQGAQLELQAEMTKFAMQLQEDIRQGSAEIAKIAAEIENMQATTEGDVEDRHVAILQSVMKLMDGQNQQKLGQLEIVKKQLEIQRERVKAGAGDGGNVRRLAGPSGNGGGKGASGEKKTGTEG